MKERKMALATLVSRLRMATLALCLSGCSSEIPLQFEGDTPAVSSDSVLSENLNFIELGFGTGKSGFGAATLSQVVQATDSVTYESGGNLHIEHRVSFGGREVHVVVTLVVLPHAISEDTELSLNLDDETLVGNVDVTFQPHGITFSRPAILNIQARGLDLSGLDTQQIDIYYDNPDSGQWEKMPRKRVIINENNGFINVVAAEIPHFSRYAVAWAN